MMVMMMEEGDANTQCPAFIATVKPEHPFTKHTMW